MKKFIYWYSVAYGLAICGFTTFFHEFWNGETQAFQIGKYSQTLKDLLLEVRYEGHPPLIYFFFFVTSRVLPIPYSFTLLALIGSIVLCLGTYHFLKMYLRESFAILFTILLSLSFTFAYELGVVVRGYGLGLGCVLWAISFHQEKKHLPTAIVFLILALLASPHSALFAVIAFVVFYVRRPAQKWISISVFGLSSAGVFLYCVMPLETRPFQGQPFPEFGELMRRIGLSAKEFIFPTTWWMLLDNPIARNIAMATTATWIFFTIRAVKQSKLARKPLHGNLILWAGVNFCAFAVALWFFHFGGYRHRLHMYLPLQLCLLVLAFSKPEKGAMGDHLKSRLIAGLWIFISLTLSAVNFVEDYRKDFSPSKTIARYLPTHATVIAEVDWRVTSLAFWRDDLQIRPLNGGGQLYRFSRWDRSREKSFDWVAILKQVCITEQQGNVVGLTHQNIDELCVWCGTLPGAPRWYPPGNPVVDEGQVAVSCSCEKFRKHPRFEK